MATKVYKKIIHNNGDEKIEFIGLYSHADPALKYCINLNFEWIREFSYFYDSEDEIGNNLYYDQTPEYHFTPLRI